MQGRGTGRGHTCSRSHNCYRNLNNAAEEQSLFGIPIPLLSNRTCLSSSILSRGAGLCLSIPSSLRNGLGLITGRCTAQNHHHNLNEHTQKPRSHRMFLKLHRNNIVLRMISGWSAYLLCFRYLPASPGELCSSAKEEEGRRSG